MNNEESLFGGHVLTRKKSVHGFRTTARTDRRRQMSRALRHLGNGRTEALNDTATLPPPPRLEKQVYRAFAASRCVRARASGRFYYQSGRMTSPKRQPIRPRILWNAAITITRPEFRVRVHATTPVRYYYFALCLYSLLFLLYIYFFFSLLFFLTHSVSIFPTRTKL